MLFLLFQLGKDSYALDAGQVAEVLPLIDIKEIPQSPPGVAGVINYRNGPVPVIDLSKIMLGHAAPVRLSTRIILVYYAGKNGETHLLGLIAEGATETMRCELDQFVAAGVTNDAVPYFGTVMPSPRGLVQRVQINELLTDSVRDILFKPLVSVR
jgi:chemotaxis-related protein WspB